MGRMIIEDIKHCLKAMVECEVCEECQLYGTTGTDHCEHDCVCGALDIIDKYQKIQEIVKSWEADTWTDGISEDCMEKIREVIEDENVMD
jgi:hypothetical protein